MLTSIGLNQGMLVAVMITAAAVYLVLRWAGRWSGKKGVGCSGACHGCAQSNRGVTSAFVPADQLHISRQHDQTSSG
ncbi:MAG: FeoB-associated Cys-rich membrane protein [Planctomycetes bacterium]|nr:FeoB-associated Cys-rich membrane protein [Planctomycetota bacterium]